jgi:anti-sigma factor RsiW
MATLEQLSAALIKADAAGNTADAKTFADAIRQMKAAPATPVLSDSLQPSVAQVSPNEIPGARKELTKGQQVYQGVRNFAAPTIEAAGAIGGGIIGGGAGTLVAPGVGTATGAVAGAGLGYGIAKEYLENFDVLMGMKAPRTGAAQVTEPVRNILEGSTFEA